MSVMPRTSVSENIRKVVTRIVIVAILIVSMVAVYSLFRLRKISSQTMIKEMESNVTSIVADKVYIAELGLKAYSDYISEFSKLVGTIYDNPEKFPKKTVNPIDKEVWEEYRLQRNLATTDYKLKDVEDEMSHLANLETQWWLLMESYGDYVSSAYLGTETGFLLSYDKYSYLADISPDGEVYFDFLQRTWYKAAKEANGVIFTDLSQDYFGRGLTLTCAAPFYNKGEFAGVVAMDILVGDLQKSVIDVDLGKGTYAFLVDGSNGDIIASPYIDKRQTEFENIKDKNNEYYPFYENILSGESSLSLYGDTYVAYAPINVAKWVFCIKIPRELILEPVYSMDTLIIRIIIVFIIIFILVQIVSFFVVKRTANKITVPIRDLKYDVEEISGGNLDYIARVESNDEIGDLANAFNNMTLSIKNYINDLTKLTAEKERIGAELNVATHIQSSMLPSIFPAFPNDKRFDIYATMDPAKEVGGDFYDFFFIDESRFVLVIADVSGKGIPAALFMMRSKTAIRSFAEQKFSSTEILNKVNNFLCEGNDAEMFVTAWIGIIDLRTGNMVCANAGHEFPILLRANGDYEILKDEHSLPLAAVEGMQTKEYYLKMNPGDRIFVYTDGVPEAINGDKEQYGLVRLVEVLNENKDCTFEELLPKIRQDVADFANGEEQFDDITMLGFIFNDYLDEMSFLKQSKKYDNNSEKTI